MWSTFSVFFDLLPTRSVCVWVSTRAGVRVGMVLVLVLVLVLLLVENILLHIVWGPRAGILHILYLLYILHISLTRLAYKGSYTIALSAGK